MKIPGSLKKQIAVLALQVAMGLTSDSDAIAQSLEAIASAIRTQTNANQH